MTDLLASVAAVVSFSITLMAFVFPNVPLVARRLLFRWSARYALAELGKLRADLLLEGGALEADAGREELQQPFFQVND